MCQSFYQSYSPVPLVTKTMTLRLNIKFDSGMIKSSHGQQALPLKPRQKYKIILSINRLSSFFLRTDMSNTLKLKNILNFAKI